MNDHVRNVFKGKVLQLNLERVDAAERADDRTRDRASPGRRRHRRRSTPDHRVCLLRQFRHATGGWITELPAGKLDNDEDAARLRATRTRRRSRRRRPRRWDKLGEFFSSPGVLTEVIHVFLARDLAAGDLRARRRTKCFDVRWVPFAEALQLATAGRLQDAKTHRRPGLGARRRGSAGTPANGACDRIP